MGGLGGGTQGALSWHLAQSKARWKGEGPPVGDVSTIEQQPRNQRHDDHETADQPVLFSHQEPAKVKRTA